jgi:hypothetical protein
MVREEIERRRRAVTVAAMLAGRRKRGRGRRKE